MDANDSTPYAALSPELVLDAIDRLGYVTDGALTALNSYENRVYQIGIDEAEPIIAKFYRPNRWSDAAIREEHAFTLELADAELECVAPSAHDGETLFEHESFRYAVFPRRAGQAPNIEDPAVLKVMGHAIGRMHAIGAATEFEHRVALTVERLGTESRKFLLESQFLPPDIEEAYASTTEHLLERLGETFAQPQQQIRLHGDCHMGNVLWRYDAPNFVDFDDTMTGPAVQDLWMLLSGEREERLTQLETLLQAYETFQPFDTRQLRLIEGLRTLRLMHHAAWIARRWDDPAFPAAFTWFDTPRYWSDHVLELREQLALIEEPPLEYFR